MKSLTVFESSVIGFFVGALVATYILCIDATGGHIGSILSVISLQPALGLIDVPSSAALVVDFVFFVLVYTMYAAIIGFLARKNMKTLLVIIPVVIILGLAVFYEQKNAPAASDLVASSYSAFQSLAKQAVKAAPQEYFGNEAVHDLNGDGKDDVAFLLSRTDPDRGILYYLSAALAIDAGHQGTNLVFLGNNVVPQSIAIENGIIDIPYTDSSSKTATTTRHFYAHVLDGALEQIQLPGKNDALLWGETGENGSAMIFTSCGEDNAMLLDGSSTALKAIRGEIDGMASTSASSTLVFGALVGKKHALSTKNASSSPYSTGYTVDGIADFVPGGACM